MTGRGLREVFRQLWRWGPDWEAGCVPGVELKARLPIATRSAEDSLHENTPQIAACSTEESFLPSASLYKTRNLTAENQNHGEITRRESTAPSGNSIQLNRAN
jgi:hypothetical protein